MKRIVPAAALLAALTGCDDQINADSVQNLNLTKPLEFKVFEFNTPMTEGGSTTGGFTPTGMPSAETHYCVLSRVAGDFQGFGEVVRLSNDGGQWSLTGQSGQATGVSAKATCVPKYSFAMKDDKKAKLIAANVGSPEGFASSNCQTQSSPVAGAAGKALFVSGIRGRYSGGGEGLAVGDPGAGMQGLVVFNGCSNGAGGWATSYVLRPDGKTLRYFGPAGPTSDFVAATFGTSIGTPPPDPWYHSSLQTWGTAPTTITLAPVNQAVCGIIAISGKFRGSGEFVEVLPEGGSWVLRIGNLQPSDGFVLGAARCVLRDQRG